MPPVLNIAVGDWLALSSRNHFYGWSSSMIDTALTWAVCFKRLDRPISIEICEILASSRTRVKTRLPLEWLGYRPPDSIPYIALSIFAPTLTACFQVSCVLPYCQSLNLLAFSWHFPATLQRTGAKNTKIVAGRQLTVEDVRGTDRKVQMSRVSQVSRVSKSLEDKLR